MIKSLFHSCVDYGYTVKGQWKVQFLPIALLDTSQVSEFIVAEDATKKHFMEGIMQNYEQILQELGIEIPEDKKTELKKKMNENYKTINEFNSKVAKMEEYKASLDDVTAKLDGFKDVNVSELQSRIATLTADLEREKSGRQADALRVERTAVLDEFLKDKKFVNSITEKSIRASIMEELEKNTGKSVEKIFDGLTKDKEGKLIPSILVEEAEENRARFTQQSGSRNSSGTTMTRKDIMSIKDAGERQRKIAENLSLFV